MIYILNSNSEPITGLVGPELDISGKCTGWEDHVVYGLITDDATTPAPVVGALVRASNKTNNHVLGYGYSGCDGYYMIAVDAANNDWPSSGDVLIEIVGSDTSHTTAECATP